MPFLKSLQSLSVVVILLISASCNQLSSPPSVTSRPEAVTKFQKIIKEEFKYSAIVRDIGNTVWIYVPQEDNILEIQSTSSLPLPFKKMTIHFLKVTLQGKIYNIDYAIVMEKKYGGSGPDFTTAYPENFQRKQQNILTSVARSYLDMEEVPGDVEYMGAKKQATHENLVDAYVKTSRPPQFFVIVFADIIRGIKMVNTTHFRDLKNSMTGALPSEEFQKRYLSEVKGDTSLIGDKTGEYLQYRDIPLAEFLAKQIEYRINFKYQQSSSPPGEDTVKEILRIAGDTFRAYDFQDFELIKLHDLETDKLSAFEPAQLKAFQE